MSKKTVTLVNTSDKTYKFEIGHMPGQPPTKYDVAPGETCEVPAGYCQAAYGRRSMIERRAPGLKPVGEVPEPAPKPQPTPASPKAVSSDTMFTNPMEPKVKTKKWAKAKKGDK